jgi:phosphoribosylformimino-5-aminoimidazole carboxamide ribotide isomerase
MEIIPAIDIMDNRVVRLTKGDPEKKKVYMESPLKTALFWQDQGASLLHIIDLDAALGKKGSEQVIVQISKRLDIPIQTGGGIRTLNKARRLLDLGVEKVILGSMPFKKPEDTNTLLQEYGSSRIIIALDHENKSVKIEGWKKFGEKSLEEALETYTSKGFKWFLVTDITRDGTLDGPDVNLFRDISEMASIIASGGVSRIQDIQDLKRTGVKAVVIGKALYEEKFTLTQAIEEVQKC